MKNINKVILFSIVLTLALGFGLVFLPQSVDASGSCSLSAGPNQILVTFSGLIRSDQGLDNAKTSFRSASIPAGEYKITLDSFDDHSHKGGQNQPNEQWYVEFYANNTKIAQSGTISDLPSNQDRIVQRVNNSLKISHNVNKVRAFHAFYPNSNPNSIEPECVLLERIDVEEDLVGSCSVNVSSAEIGETVTWSANASGGTGNFQYSWSGTDGLSGSNSSVSKTYSSKGLKSGSVTITSGTQSITRNCSVFIEKEQEQNLVGSCSVNPSNLKIGQTATFKASASGGNGTFNYSWSGTDGLSGSSSSVNKSYSTSGTKSASVVITSGTQSITRNCSVFVEKPVVDNLVGSCSVNPSDPQVGDSVNWSANASGGTGNFQYSWSGTDGLSSSNSSVSKSYSTSGTKNASVTITSGSQSITRNCSVFVDEPEDDDLVGSCSVSPSSPEIGETVTWSATASGGDGNFDYSWSGTDGLSSSNSSVSRSYSTDGLKTGAVTITSGSQSITRSCSVFVEEEEEDDLELFCTPDGGTFDIDERVTWQAHASGGGGGYEYDWSGTDGLDGDSRTESIRYDDDGTKRANVRVSSNDGQTETATCRIFVEEEDDDDFDISCEVSDTRIDAGDRVTFEVDIDGGDSPYRIEWDGDIDDIDDFDDNDRRQTVRIDDEGRYEIEVEVRDDDGRRETDQCRTIVVDNDDDNDVDVSVTSFSSGGGQVAGVALSQIPVTGLTNNPVLDAILYSLAGLTLLVIGSISMFILRKREQVPVAVNTGYAEVGASDYTEDEIVSSLEDIAHKKRVIVSAEAMETLMLRSKHNKIKALILLNEAIAKTKKDISTDAWVVLSKQKISDVL